MGFMDFFKGFFGSIVGALFQKAAQTSVAAIAEGLGDIAMEAVKQANEGNFTSGSEKRKAAFDAIKAKAVEEGKAFTSHAANIAIELALAILQSKTVQK